MRLPRGVVKKRRSYFARIQTKGGEESFPLGRDPDVATTKLNAIKAALDAGRSPDEIRADLREGMHPLASRAKPEASTEATVSEVARRWLRERIEVELEPRNAGMIRSRVDEYIIPFLGSRPIRSVKRADCHAFKGHMPTTRPDLQPSTLRHYLRTLRELLSWAEEVEVIDSNPWPRKRIMPRVEKRAPDRLSEEQVAVLVALPDHWGFTLRFLLSTGLRWGEACRAKRRDIEGGQLIVRKSKSGKPRRVPLSKAILTEIMRLGGDWIVPRQRHAPGGRAERSSSSFNLTIRRLVEKHKETLDAEQRRSLDGLERFHVHQTRHTFACRYLEGDGIVTMLQEILGHASVEQTQQYGRPDEKAIRADAARVFAAWERTGS